MLQSGLLPHTQTWHASLNVLCDFHSVLHDQMVWSLASAFLLALVTRPKAILNGIRIAVRFSRSKTANRTALSVLSQQLPPALDEKNSKVK